MTLPAQEIPLLADTLTQIQESIRLLHLKIDSLSAKPPSAPPPSSTSTPALYSSVVKAAFTDQEKIREKAKRAVLVGSMEEATPELTAAMDEENLKLLIERTKDRELIDAFSSSLISHKRHPATRKEGQRSVVKYNLQTSTLRDKFLSCIRVIDGRPESFTPGMYVRRDLMPMELLQEKEAKAEALRRNRECGFLMWGVRDTDVIKFNGPKFRPLPNRLREDYVKPDNNELKEMPKEPVKPKMNENAPANAELPSSTEMPPVPRLAKEDDIPSSAHVTLRKKTTVTSSDSSVNPVKSDISSGGTSSAMKDPAPLDE